MNRPTDLVWRVVTSLRLTIVCLVALMILVVACTLAQVNLGTWGAVEVYMRSEPLSEDEGPFQEVLDLEREAHDLAALLHLMRGESRSAEDGQHAAAHRVEEGPREAIDVDRRALP